MAGEIRDGFGKHFNDRFETIEEDVNLLKTGFIFVVAILFFIVFILTGCSGWTYNGIRGDDLKNFNLENGAGFLSSFAVHAAGHIIYAELTGHDYHIEGQSEIIDGYVDDDSAAWFARYGFLSQLAVGYAAKGLGWRGDFWDGYNLGTQVQILTYPIRRNWINGGGDDFDMIDRQSNPWLEWAAYSALAVGLSLDDIKKINY